jgi:hypothetical protein
MFQAEFVSSRIISRLRSTLLFSIAGIRIEKITERKSVIVSTVGRTIRARKDFHGTLFICTDIIIYSYELMFTVFYQDFLIISPNGYLANFKMVK